MEEKNSGCTMWILSLGEMPYFNSEMIPSAVQLEVSCII